MEDFHDPAQKVYVDFAREVDAYIAAHCPKLTSRKVLATEDSMEKLLKVSDGMDAHIISPRSYIYVFLTAETPAGAPVELFKAFGDDCPAYIRRSLHQNTRNPFSFRTV